MPHFSLLYENSDILVGASDCFGSGISEARKFVRTNRVVAGAASRLVGCDDVHSRNGAFDGRVVLRGDATSR